MPSWTSFESRKQLKKHVDYEQLINVLAMDKSMLEEELRATKAKLKLSYLCNNLYDLCAQMVTYFAANDSCKADAILYAQMVRTYTLLQMQVAKQMQDSKQMLIAIANAIACSKANAANAIACRKTNACCKCNCKCLQMQLQML
ncbi:hypothetical protein Tco_1469558 [Tanacetum coccineum]